MKNSYVSALLDRVGLADQIHKHPDAMSGGQNQRCAIIRALVNQPKIVLADDPTWNIDSRSGSEVFSIMREMNRGKESLLSCLPTTIALPGRRIASWPSKTTGCAK